MSRNPRYRCSFQIKFWFLAFIGCAGSLYAGYNPLIAYNTDDTRFIIASAGKYNYPLPLQVLFQPVSTNDLRPIISFLDSLSDTGILTQAESAKLKRLKQHIFFTQSLFNRENGEKDVRFHANLDLTGSVVGSTGNDDALRLQGVIGPGLGGNSGRLSFYSHIDVWTDYRSDSLYHMSSYQPYDGIPYNLYGREKSSHVRSSDIFRAGVVLQQKLITLETAIDSWRMGPALFYPLTFSGTTPPLTFARIHLNLMGATYTHAFGLLKNQKDLNKYIYTHRLSFPLWSWGSAGFNEVIINGSTTDQIDSLDPNNALRRDYYGQKRNAEWAYLIPFVPFAFAQHYVGDRDNTLISADLTINFPRSFRWYAEMLIDDVTSPWTIFSDDWGNKWALTAGAQYFATVLSRDVTTTFEYSHVEPWVYTHFYGWSHNYTHFGMPLGSPLGPNSQAFVGDVSVGLTARHVLGLTLTHEMKGTSRGSSIGNVFQDSVYTFNSVTYNLQNPDSPRKEFLGPNPLTLTTLSLSWRYDPFKFFSITTQCDFKSSKKISTAVIGKFSF